jgi:enamine deaminase RidA (YjgF/YER057c/UK114 family)
MTSGTTMRVHCGLAHWVEVAEDTSRDARGQIAQVLARIDATLAGIRSDQTRLLQVLVSIADDPDAASTARVSRRAA